MSIQPLGREVYPVAGTAGHRPYGTGAEHGGRFPSDYPVAIAVYEHRPDAPDPVLVTAERGEDYQGVAGRTYNFYVTSQESGRPAAWIQYFWVTDTGRNSSGWQLLPVDGRVTVATEPSETWLRFVAAPTTGTGEDEVTIELLSPDSPGAQALESGSEDGQR